MDEQHTYSVHVHCSDWQMNKTKRNAQTNKQKKIERKINNSFFS